MPPDAIPALDALRTWFTDQGWQPHAFQDDAWRAFGDGRSGLIHVPTGAGKTYAAGIAPLAAIQDGGRSGLQLLWVTPLRATSADTARALRRPVRDLGWTLRIETRTGDTPAAEKARQRRALPEVLITTPESLCLLLTRPDAAEVFAGLRAVVLDEWHELLSTKRGSQTELALARVRRFAPEARTWALSATLANLDEAAQVAVGSDAAAMVVTADLRRDVVIETVLPPELDSFPWAGHLGIAMLDAVLARLDPARSTLIFTNTRSQAELWHDAIRRARPEWFEFLGLHHGSIDHEERERIEDGLRDGRVRMVVCTASLDLGVDFGPVEQVVQIGSPRGIARLMQRAGRAAHRPHASCRVLCVPTHALELIECAAVRRAIARGEIEARRPIARPLDVLAQHLVTCAIGGGFDLEAMRAEVRTAHSFRTLTDDEYAWTIELLEKGGASLERYPEYHRLVRDPLTGRCTLTERRKVTWHRMNVGTITSHGTVELKFMNGRSLGTCEESFVARLRPGETFLFGGRVLQVVHQHGLEVRVRPATGRTRHTPRWEGGRLPLSACLGAAMRRTFHELDEGRAGEDPELGAAGPVLDAQMRLSMLPPEDAVLCEIGATRDGAHLFVYPFEGRLVHEGLAAILALRLGRRRQGTFSLAVNDYGFEVLCPDRDYPFAALLDIELFSTDELVDDVREAIDLGRLARHQFRDVARVAGLVMQNLPRQRRSNRALMTSAGLVYDVFERHDPDNLLVEQARREVLEAQFERTRLVATMERIRTAGLAVTFPRRPTPLGFPLLIERVRARLSNESLLDRIERMKAAFA